MSAFDDEAKAHRTLLLPQEQGELTRESLLKRGFGLYIDDDGTEHPDELLADVERFGLAAMRFARVDEYDGSFTEDPGQLATVATLATICIKHNDHFEHHIDTGYDYRVQPLHDVREYFKHNVVKILEGENDLLQDVAEVIYQKPEGEDGPHPGRVCEGIEYRDDLDTYCFKIPIQAASPKCVVRDADGTPRNAFEDRIFYVPLDDIDSKYDEYLQKGFKQLVATQESLLDPEMEEWIVANEARMSDTIQEHIDASRYERIWTDWQRGERMVQVIKNAVKDAPDDLVTIGEFYTAGDLYEAKQQYLPEGQWEEGWLGGIGSVQSMAQILGDHSDHRDVEIEEREGEPNRYCIKDTDRGVESLHVTEAADLFELPCFAAMKEHLEENGPTRKDLWNFVRTAWWLSPYYSSRPGDHTLDDEFMADIHDTFEEFPWYDEDKTEYQTRYEIEHGDIEGNIPRPMNCDHEDMQRYCIGQDVCPYSIYGSLPFPNAMYEFLDDDEPGF